MIRFRYLEECGVAVAAVTEGVDGDCSRHGGAAAAANRAAACFAAGIGSGGLVYAEQVHGTAIAEAGGYRISSGEQAPFRQTDGLITNVKGLPLAIFIADCVPLFLYDPVHEAIGLVHAGREGSRGRIAELAVARMHAAFGTRAGDLYALIGPSIGPCCYAISPELVRACAAEGWPLEDNRLDLWTMNVRQLMAAGVPEPHVRISGLCTRCNGRFYSHRRDPDGRRNMALMML